MAYIKTEWKDRVVEYPNRYTDQNGVVHILSPSPGVITEEGTPITAVDMNKLEEGVRQGVLASGTELGAVNKALYGVENVDDALKGVYSQKKNIVIIDTSGTWIPPKENMLIDIFMIGGGSNGGAGGKGQTNGAAGGGGGGGGGGGIARTILNYKVTNTTPIQVIVGGISGKTVFNDISTMLISTMGTEGGLYGGTGGTGGAGGGGGGRGTNGIGIGGIGGSGYGNTGATGGGTGGDGGAGKYFENYAGYCILNNTMYGGAGSGGGSGAGGSYTYGAGGIASNGGGGAGGTGGTYGNGTGMNGYNATKYGAGGGGGGGGGATSSSTGGGTGGNGGLGMKGCVIIAYN